jgi:exodeoxyribonuclease V alpha subunit
MCLHTGHYKMLQRNMLYTGITRSRKLVILVAHPQAVSMAVRNNQVSKRNTYLMERLTGNPMQMAA